MMFQYSVKTPWWLKMIFPQKLIWDLPVSVAPVVYITFDDGPHPAITPFVLELLAKYNAKATFFCVGNNVTKFPATYNQILIDGHATANHTYNHLNGWKTDDESYINNIEKAGEHIKSRLFRPPYGKIKRSQARRLWQLHPDWKVIMWDVLSADFDKNISPQQCLDNVIKNVKPGSIILFHDSEKALDRMSFSLPKVLEYCQSKGWKMETIPG